MKSRLSHLRLIAAVAAFAMSHASASAGAASFSRLAPLPAAKIVAAAEEYPGGSYGAARLLDGNPETAYASNAKGAGTFVEFDFGAPVRIAAFKHVDRNDPATVAASQLTLADAATVAGSLRSTCFSAAMRTGAPKSNSTKVPAPLAFEAYAVSGFPSSSLAAP